MAEAPLSNEEILRYSRHLLMPEVGVAGQRRLKGASVLIVGAGGLGAPLSLYLAAAGVGRLGLVDFDKIDATNLHRQVLFTQGDVGRSKLQVASERLRGVNPHVDFRLHETRLTSANALEIARDYDIVADGTDNFATRYLVNDTCVLLGKPNVYGSIFRFDGQASVFDASRGPCYRCLYPEPPPPGLVPSCAEGGVLGILPGIIGLIQATEAVKLILGQGDPLIGRLLLFDALGMTFRELRLEKNPRCPVCGEQPAIRELIDYEAFCGGGAIEEPREESALSASELKRLLECGQPIRLVDIREPHEFEICRIEGASLVPQARLAQTLEDWDPELPVVVYCHHGVRSRAALRTLKSAGFRRAQHLAGGIDAWSRLIDPSVPRY